MNTGKVVLGTIAGVAIGGILGILFAPEKGSVTRKQIAKKGNDSMSDLKSICSDFVDTLKENLQATKKVTKDLAETGAENFERLNKDLLDEAKNF